MSTPSFANPIPMYFGPNMGPNLAPLQAFFNSTDSGNQEALRGRWETFALVLKTADPDAGERLFRILNASSELGEHQEELVRFFQGVSPEALQLAAQKLASLIATQTEAQVRPNLFQSSEMAAQKLREVMAPAPSTGNGLANDLTRLRGDEKSPPRNVHVGADIPQAVRRKLPSRLIKVRSQGIKSVEDIPHAIKYLTWVHPGFEKLFDIIRRENISIELGPENLSYSYAQGTFHHAVDRNSPDYGRKIVIERGATPDILLHEAMHSLPLSVIRAILPDDLFPLSSILLPQVDPSDRFDNLRNAILENIRLNETISFGSQGLFYELERNHGVTPIFHAEMMGDIDGAWKRGKLEGVRNTFPQYLPHYEERLGLQTIFLALIVKVEGRTTLSEEELDTITKVSKGQFPFQNILEYFQNYLNRYVQQRGLELPPYFYSLKSVVRRMQIHSLEDLSTEGLVKAVDSIFAELENLERPLTSEPLPAPRTLEAQDIPPQESHENRIRLFAAYSGVVDRVLDNPPASLSREEISALVSYVRMVPPQVARQLDERLQVYLGAGFEDLRVTLGLILYEKGFQERGRKLVSESLTTQLLPEALPMIQRIMGPDAAIEFIRHEADALVKFREAFVRGFQTWGLEQFMWDDAKWENAVQELLAYPELLSEKRWQEVGKWIFEHGEVDSALEEDQLFNLSRTAFAKELYEYSERESTLIKMLSSLRANAQITGETRDAIEQIWTDIKTRNQAAYAVLVRLMKLGDEFPLSSPVSDRSGVLSHFFSEDLAEIFKNFPGAQRKRAITLLEIKNQRSWSDPKEVTRLANELAGEIESRVEEGEGFKSELLLLKDLMDASIRKNQKPAAAGKQSLPDFRKALEVLLSARVIQKIDELHYLTSGHDLLTPNYFIVWHDKVTFDSRLEGGVDLKLAWIQRAILLDPPRASNYFEQGLQFLRALSKTASQDSLDDGICLKIITVLAPNGVQLLAQALRFNNQNVADKLMVLLFRDLTSLFPADRKFDGEDFHDLHGRLFRDVIASHLHLIPLEWDFQMAQARIQAQAEGKLGGWLRRIQDEMNRGGHPISIEGLNYLAEPFLESKDFTTLETLYQFMIQKSLMDLKRENITETMRAIQDSPLPDAIKDTLLEGFVRRLFDLITTFRGADLSLVHHLQGLFPWRTPFMQANDLPHYPKTEALLIERLAGIPELVELQRGKDDRVRLAAFSAAGLPLQRYAPWVENLFDDPQGPAELQGLSLRRDDRAILKNLGLPHPYDIPSEIASAEIERFLKKEGGRIEEILSPSPRPSPTRGEGEEQQTDAVIRVLSRMLGSELRFLVSQNKKPHTQVPISESRMGSFLLYWLQREYQGVRPPLEKGGRGDFIMENASTKSPLIPLFQRGASPETASSRGEGDRSPYLKQIQEMFFSAGPNNIRRLDQARIMLDWNLSREEKRKVFAQATGHLIFSKRVQQRLESLKNAPEETEMAYYRLLLSIHYEQHPGNMISNFLLDRLEKSRNLLYEYDSFLKTSQTQHPLILSELGLSRLVGEGSRVRSWTQFSVLERLQRYLQALQFLHQYIQNEDGEKSYAYADSGYFDFSMSTVKRHLAAFLPLFQKDGWEGNLENKYFSENLADEFSDYHISSNLETFAEMLATGGWAEKVDEWLDKHYQSNFSLQKRSKLLNRHLDLEAQIAQVEALSRDMIHEDLADRLQEIKIPEFIQSREGLEKDLFIYTLQAIDPAQRTLLNQNLQEAKNDQERLLALGQAAHLEKMLQLASVHPAVPTEYQRQFAVFQEEVPSRDPIDVQRTIDGTLLSDERGMLVVDTKHPLKEGTIGGVYPATYEGREFILKVIPEGKEGDLRDSLRVVQEIRRFLWASHYAQAGARAVDDLLAFYERTMDEELNLLNEVKHAEQLKKVLPEGFVIPQYYDDFTSPNVLAMTPLYSRRLKELGEEERASVFRRIDEDLIPAMLMQGVFHYDLHPGNIGLLPDGRIVLYDVGRVQKLSPQEHENLMAFYAALQTKQVGELKTLLEKMGTVRDEEEFAHVETLLAELLQHQDPLQSLEKIYPRLSDYGFQLGDNYVKLLFMFVTWRGTKGALGGGS